MYRSPDSRCVMRGEGGLHSVTQPVARTVVACAITPIQRARLSDALRNRAELRLTDSFVELARVLRESVDPIDAVVLSVRDAGGGDALATVRDVATHRPRTAIVMYS